MTKQKVILLVAVLISVGGTAALLARMQGHQHLGKPGLKMINQMVYDETGKVIGTNTVDLPKGVLAYQSRVQSISTNETGWLPKDTTFARRFYEADDKFGIMLTVIMMGTDRGSIHKPEICLSAQGWQIDGKKDVLAIPISQPTAYELPVKRLIASKTLQAPNGSTQPVRALYVYWFVADHQLTARHGERMWWTAKELMRSGTLQRWAYVSCLTHCLPGQEEATYNRLKEFIAAAVPQFQLATSAAPVLARK